MTARLTVPPWAMLLVVALLAAVLAN